MPVLFPILSGLRSNAVVRVLGGIDSQLATDQGARNHRYAFNEAFLGNRVYRTEALGGYREQIFQEAFNLPCTPELKLVGAYNPVPSIVAAYQNVLRGSFGQELKVAEEVNGQPVNPTLADEKNSPLARLWRWSQLDTHKQLLQEWAANLGTVGLRIVAVNDERPENKRVYIGIDHPGAIYDFDEDERRNVTAVELRYKVMGGPIGSREEVEVREVITKDEFFKDVGGRKTTTPNELGVCPYVILRHRDDGGAFGKWAYLGVEDTVHWINWMIVNEGESIMEHARPTWFSAAGGPTPTEVPLKGGKNLVYARVDENTPNPIFHPLVAPLDHAGPLAFLQQQVDWLHERQPELAIVALKVLSGQSGETIAKLQVPAESAIKKARAQYENALGRALQIGLSEGVRMGMWDLGTGTGTAEAADAAYQSGKEDFAFEERSALPMTPFDRITNADANVADDKARATMAGLFQKLGLPDIEVFKKAGYTEEEAKELVEQAAKEFEEEQAVIQDFAPPRPNGNGGGRRVTAPAR